MNKETFKEIFDRTNSLYLITLDTRLGHCTEEIQDSDYWVGGDEGSFTNNSNINFDTLENAERYYERNYKEVLVFDDERERDEKVDEMEENGTWID